MTELLRSIMAIRRGLHRPHETDQTFRMNEHTRDRLLNLFGMATFKDIGVIIVIDPTLPNDEVQNARGRGRPKKTESTPGPEGGTR